MSTILANGKGWQWSETCVSMNDGKHRRCFNFLLNKCNQCDFPFFQAIWGNIWKTHKLEKSRTNACNDLEHVWLWRRAPSTKLKLPPNHFAWRTVGQSVRLTSMWWSRTLDPEILAWACDLWTSDHLTLSELRNGNLGKKSIGGTLAPGSCTKMLLLVLACLHQPAGSSHLPHISVGPYRPWTSSHQHKPWGSHPQHQELHPIQQETNHPGYQTNIVIDPYAKVGIEIRGKI